MWPEHKEDEKFWLQAKINIFRGERADIYRRESAFQNCLAKF